MYKIVFNGRKIVFNGRQQSNKLSKLSDDMTANYPFNDLVGCVLF